MSTFKFNLGCGTTLQLSEMEAAGLSIIPVNDDKPIAPFSEHLHASGITTANCYPPNVWAKATGIMIMTGFKSQRDFSEFTYSLMDIDIEAAMIARYPELVDQIVQAYKIGAASTPCIARTKSGGLRLSCYIASCESKQSFRDKKDDEMLIEFFSLNAYSRWDRRYKMIEGSILDAPEMRVEAIQLMAQLAVSVGYRKKKKSTSGPRSVTTTSTIGDIVIEWDSLGRSQYLPKEHCKIRDHRSNNDAVSFYKHDDGSIGGYCHACEEGWIEVPPKHQKPRPRRAVNINDAPQPILSPDEANLLPAKPTFADRQLYQASLVQQGTLSPLALQRPNAVTLQTETQLQTIPLNESDREIKSALYNSGRVTGLNSPTGSGKDYQHIGYLVDTGKYSIETKPHSRLAEEKIHRIHEHLTAIRIYGILHGADIVEAMPMEQRIEEAFPEDRSWVCIQPTRVFNYIQKGGNRHQGPCLDCPVKDMCSFSGMNGQTQLAQNIRAVVIANNKLFIHPIFENQAMSLYLRQIQGTRIPRVAFMDEADPRSMFLSCELKLSYLHQVQTMWDGEAAADWAKHVTHLITQEQDLNALQDYILGIPLATRQRIADQLTRIRVRCTAQPERIVGTEDNKVLSEITVTFPSGNQAFIAVDTDAYQFLRGQNQPVLKPRNVPQDGWLPISLDAAYHLGVYGKPEDMNDMQIQTELPQVYSRKWNPFDNLYRFFTRYQRPADAPIHFHDNTLFWEIPPVIPVWIEKLVLMSATLNEELLKRTLSAIASDIDFMKVKPTPLVQGSQIFRIRTGTYCRRTILEQVKDDHGKYATNGLAAAGERFVEMIKHEVQQDRTQTHAIITYKYITDMLGDWIDEQPNVLSAAHFGGLVGIDEMSEADVLWILGTPELADTDIRRLAKRFYGNDEEPLDYTRTEDGTYIDERMQLVHAIIVQGELMQAAGRARMNRVKGTLMLLTAVDVPTVTDRKECIEFDYQDWLIDKNIKRLADRVKERETAEIAYNTDLHNTELTASDIATRNRLPAKRVKKDRKDLGILTNRGGSKSKLTDKQIQQIKDNAAAGLSQRQNAADVGVPRTTLQRVLKS